MEEELLSLKEHAEILRKERSLTTSEKCRERRITAEDIGGPLFLALMGIPSLYSGFNTLYNSYQSRSWPQVQGVIIYSKASGEFGAYGADVYFLEVEYEYVVRGVIHESRMHGGWFEIEYFRDRMAETFPEGRRVAVYYDPEDPQLSVIEPGIPLRHVFWMLVGALFVGGGVWTARNTLTLKCRDQVGKES